MVLLLWWTVRWSRCLLVDKIIGKAEVVVKSLGESLKNIKGNSGWRNLG